MTDVITTCGGTVTLNNTYWQSPTTGVSAPSTCALTVRMDTKFVEQSIRPICQVRYVANYLNKKKHNIFLILNKTV